MTIGVTNPTKHALTIVTLDRYILVELHNRRGHFVTGTRVEDLQEAPSAGDYRALPAGGQVEAIYRVEARRGPPTEDGLPTYLVGGWRFEDVPARNTIRVTYKADLMMPNLPSKLKKSFFRGPSDSTTQKIDLPA